MSSATVSPVLADTFSKAVGALASPGALLVTIALTGVGSSGPEIGCYELVSKLAREHNQRLERGDAALDAIRIVPVIPLTVARFQGNTNE